jgi:NitT/TauT family transport system ATP-binding protein
MRVRVESISKVYPAPRRGGLVALEDISLEVRDGEFVTILGPSGCGNRRSCRSWPGSRRRAAGASPRGALRAWLTAVVFQEHALFPWRTVHDNVVFGLEVQGIPAAERAAASARRLLELVGWRASPIATRTTSRAACASGWPSPGRSPSSRLLLMDEPFSALDGRAARSCSSSCSRWGDGRRSILCHPSDPGGPPRRSGRRDDAASGPILACGRFRSSRPRDERTMLDPAFVALVDECWQLISTSARGLRRCP